jgi:hypothetical protein
MEPRDVWVVYNRVTDKILHVYADELMAYGKVKQYWEGKIVSNMGTTPPKDKIDVMTLTRACEEIEMAAASFVQ